jgi:hypothetical protein
MERAETPDVTVIVVSAARRMAALMSCSNVVELEDKLIFMFTTIGYSIATLEPNFSYGRGASSWEHLCAA